MKGKQGKKDFIDPRYAKSAMYQGVMKEIKKAGVCPFCPETFRWHTKPILRRAKGWLITESFQPYENAARHFIVVGKKHRESIVELTTGDWKEISSLLNWVIKKYRIAGGGMAMRFGPTSHTGASVSHLHVHLIVPRLKRGRAVPVWFPFG